MSKIKSGLLILLVLLTPCVLFVVGYVRGHESALRDGVKMSAEEAIACKEQGCSVWTEEELMALARKSFLEGEQAGSKVRPFDSI